MLGIFFVCLLAPVPTVAEGGKLPPIMVELAKDADGVVRVVVQRKGVATQQFTYVETVDGRDVTKTATRQLPQLSQARVPLAEVKDLVIYTADGKVADKAETLKRLERGDEVVFIAADGLKVSPKFLKLLRDDALILVSSELLAPNRSAGPSETLPQPMPTLVPVIADAAEVGRVQQRRVQALPVQALPPLPVVREQAVPIIEREAPPPK